MLCEKDAMSEKNVRKDLLFLRGLLSRLGPRYISLVNLPGVLAAIPTTALGVYYVTTTIPFTPQQVNILGIILGILIPPVAALSFLNFSRSSAGDPGCAGRAAGSACVARNRGQGLAGGDRSSPENGHFCVFQSRCSPGNPWKCCNAGLWADEAGLSALPDFW
jgi:hypothetical protein